MNISVLCDSRTVLLAIASLNYPLTEDILDCHLQLENLPSLKKIIVLQWGNAHCGVTGDEIADYLAKKGALIIQTSAPTMPFCSIRQLIKRIYKTCGHNLPIVLYISHGGIPSYICEMAVSGG